MLGSGIILQKIKGKEWGGKKRRRKTAAVNDTIIKLLTLE